MPCLALVFGGAAMLSMVRGTGRRESWYRLYLGPLAAWVWAAALIAGVAVDATLGHWEVLAVVVAGYYGGLLAVETLARPLLGRWRAPYLAGSALLWAATAATLAAASPIWLGWNLWFPSPFLRTVGGIFLFLSVGAAAWASRDVLREGLSRGHVPEGRRRYLASPLREAGTEIILGTALLTLNWGVLILAGTHLVWGLLRSRPGEREPGEDSSTPLRPSVVIPTLNEEVNVGLLLSDLDRQTREAYEVIVVDGRSTDQTASVVEGHPGARLLEGFPPVSEQRNLGGREAGGDVLIFLDADIRLEETFLEEFLKRFEHRGLGVACSFYMPPHTSKAPIKAIYALCNMLFAFLANLLPAGSGQCVAMRREIFRDNAGFSTSLKVAEDMELIRRLGRRYRFGVIPRSVRVSDRRFEEYGVLRMALVLVVMSFIFTLGRFEWANGIEYEFGNHDR
jgi:hypothetical protein